MFIQLCQYKITHDSNHVLVISLDKNYVVIKIGIAILASLIISYSLSGEINLENIGLNEILFAIALLSPIVVFYKNKKALLEGEVYTFNISMNSIEKNNRLIGELDKVRGIKIIEYENTDSQSEYELIVEIEGYDFIFFQKSSNLESYKKMGNAIANICGISFHFISNSEFNTQKYKEEQKNQFNTLVQLFEKKYIEKNEKELREISKENSPYADYAKEAAVNLLKNRDIEHK